MLRCGLIGLPMVGKTTLFNLITSAKADTAGFMSGKVEARVGMAKIPDYRIDYLVQMYSPRKVTYAQIEFTEVPGLVSGASEGKGMGNSFLAAIRDVDALVHVVRAFENPEVPHLEGTVDPARDFETVSLELLFADLGVLENRISRLEAGKRKKEQETELDVLRKCKEALEQGTPLHLLGLNEDERRLLRNYAFLTEKPMILVVNVDEHQFKSGTYPGQAAVTELAAAKGFTVIEVAAQMEMEILELPEEDRKAFLEDLGLSETGIERLAKATYGYLGLISFLTAGEDEVRAWTISQGLRAKEAAGKIHSDLERGFIRAETVAFEDLFKAGSMAKAREKGCFRLEGKDYVVQDGDIINFRFNV